MLQVSTNLKKFVKRATKTPATVWHILLKVTDSVVQETRTKRDRLQRNNCEKTKKWQKIDWTAIEKLQRDSKWPKIGSKLLQRDGGQTWRDTKLCKTVLSLSVKGPLLCRRGGGWGGFSRFETINPTFGSSYVQLFMLLPVVELSRLIKQKKNSYKTVRGKVWDQRAGVG